MSDSKKIVRVRNAMLEIFGENCWMGYNLSRKNEFTYHHIIERRCGGDISLANGALLTKYAHMDLNKIEYANKRYYELLNDLFYELNRTLKPPTKEYYKEVNGILLYANKIVTLSEYYKPSSDCILLEENALMNLEKNKKIKKNYDDIEPVYVPIEHRGKLKHKNRRNKMYKFKP